MERDVVQRVLDVEKEIHQALAEEKRKAEEWVESVRKACEDEISAIKVRQEKDFRFALENARTEARERAEELTAKATARAHALEHISQDLIRRTVLRHLTSILPGENDDRQDV